MAMSSWMGMLPALAPSSFLPKIAFCADISDSIMIQHRLDYNAFGFNILEGVCRWRAMRGGSPLRTEAEGETSAMGIWLKASYLNHSCYPTVQRWFIGDVMIWRALADIHANAELTFSYVSDKEDYAGGQKALSEYGFSCECQICVSERETPLAKVLERDMILHEIDRCFESSTITGIDDYLSLLDKLETTYVFSPSREPRRQLIVPISRLLVACKSQDMVVPLIKLCTKLLISLGFEVEDTISQWRIETWGYMCPEVVWALIELQDLENDLKTAYVMMAGEVESFEEMYGKALREDGREIEQDKDKKS